MARIYCTTNNTNWGMFVDLWEDSYSIANNTSYVIAKVYLYRPNSARYYGGTASVSVTVNGQTQSTSYYPTYPTNISAGESNAHNVATFGYTVSHNSDGTKTVSMSMSWSANFNPTSASGSGSLTLTTIPRASSITATSAYIGETSQLTVTRKSSSFTHSIKYSFGSLNGYILADGTTSSSETKITATSIGFPIPSSWYAQIPSATEGTCTLTIKTYSGTTQIGSSQTATFKARVDESTNKPTVTATVVDTNATTIALTGNNNYLIKGYSTAQVTWSSSAKNSATISTNKINGTTVTTSPYAFTLTTSTIDVVATDSRGYSTTISPSFTLKDYFIPNITTSGVRDEPTSSYMNIKFSGTFWNNSFGNVSNSLTLSWKYREAGETNWTVGGTFVENTDYKISGNNFYSGTGSSASEIQIGGTMTYDKGWDIGIFINDELYTMPVQIINITKGIPVINWGEDFLNVNGKIRENNVPLVYSAHNSNGRYIKFGNGVMICTKSVDVTGTACTTALGSIYESGVLSLGDFAAEFTSNPVVTASVASTTSAVSGMMVEGIWNVSTTYAGDFWLCRASSSSSVTGKVNVIAIGWWK